jgi:hypothetical protein
MSNAEMKHVVLAYVKEKFITSSLLQNARTMVRDEIFGDLATNVFFANGIVKKMKECGIDVKVLMKDWKQVLQMLEHFVLSDLICTNKAEGKLVTKAEKIDFFYQMEIGEQGGVRRWRTRGTPIRRCPTQILQWDFIFNTRCM